MTDRERLLRIVNIVAIRHQIDGSKEEMAARREDLLECIALELHDHGISASVDAF